MASNGPGPARRSAADEESRRLWRMAGLGATLASEVVAGVLIGYGLDYWLDTDPIFVLIGTGAGLVIGMTGFIRTALRESHRAADDAAHYRADTGASPDDPDPPA